MDPTAYRGFAIFSEGEIYHYRIDDQVQLQVASLMGFNNMTPDGDLLFVGNRKARQYWVRIEDGVMELTALDGLRLTFRKVSGGEFPLEALERLRETGGVPLEPWGR